MIEKCLSIYLVNRPTATELLNNDIFKSVRDNEIPNKSKIHQQFEIFTLKELYHWWQLTGGDVFLELKKHGLIRSSPPILSLPR